jgi:hypothetical protein
VQSFNSGDFVLNGATSGSTTIKAAAVASGTLTFPAATDTLTANATAATLTNKTIDCANNTCTVRLPNDVTGNLAVTNLNGGTSASASTFWRGDGTWAIPARSGNVNGPGSSTDANVPQWNGTTGTSLSAGLPVGITGNSTIVETNSSGLIANSLISGLPNANLANSSVTINGHSLSLGSSLSLAYSDLGNLPVTNLNGGTSASASTFWRGDGTWATPAGFGNVNGPGSSTNAYVPQWNGTTGTLLAAGLPVGMTGSSTIVQTNSSGLIANSLISELPNANLANSSVTINSHSLSLGGALSLAYSDLGNLPVSNLNGGTSASASTFWRGDGTWATPAASGYVTGPSSAVSGDIATFSGTSGTVLRDSGTQLSAFAPLASPSFTGTPSAPTAPTATNTAQIATTAYVQNQAYATLASPALSGIPTAPTPAQATNSTQIATTAFVKSQQTPISIGWIAGQNPNNAIASVINQAMTVNAIVGAVEVANGSTATVAVNHAPSGVACSSGTALHSGSFDANGTAAADQTLTVTTASLAVGDRICLQTTGGSNWSSGSAVGTITIFVSPS